MQQNATVKHIFLNCTDQFHYSSILLKAEVNYTIEMPFMFDFQWYSSCMST